MTEHVSIAENFDKYFEVLFANTESLRQESFRIRHMVYCEELGWEPLREDGLETDLFDDAAYTLLLRHRNSGRYAGTVRVIIPPPDNSAMKLPFEQYCLESLYPDFDKLNSFKRGAFGEISRLAVPEFFRRRAGETKTPYPINENATASVETEEERRNFPNIALGLYLGIIALVKICNHAATFVVVEPRLNKRLDRLGLRFKQIGDEMDYHGIRALFFLAQDEYSSDLNAEMLELFNLLERELRKQVVLLPYFSKSGARDEATV